jgi:hypothetical protein
MALRREPMPASQVVGTTVCAHAAGARSESVRARKRDLGGLIGVTSKSVKQGK